MNTNATTNTPHHGHDSLNQPRILATRHLPSTDPAATWRADLIEHTDQPGRLDLLIEGTHAGRPPAIVTMSVGAAKQLLEPQTTPAPLDTWAAHATVDGQDPDALRVVWDAVAAPAVLVVLRELLARCRRKPCAMSWCIQGGEHAEEWHASGYVELSSDDLAAGHAGWWAWAVQDPGEGVVIQLEDPTGAGVGLPAAHVAAVLAATATPDGRAALQLLLDATAGAGS